MTPRKAIAFATAVLTSLCAAVFLWSTGETAEQTRKVTAQNTTISSTRSTKLANVRVSPTAKISHVVVKFKDAAEVRMLGGQLVSKQSLSLSASQSALTPYLASRVRRLFNTQTEESIDQTRQEMQLKLRRQLADLNGYFRVELTSPAEAEALVRNLNQQDEIETAYIAPLPEPAGDIAPPTPNYQPGQDYRKVAPGGVDADYANTLPGGDGTGVKIVDIEGNWMTTHEDLDKAVGGIIAGAPINDQSWRDHGTAVLGEMIAGNNGYGMTGICYGADVGMVSIGSMSAAEAIYTAANSLSAGDLILIELHAPGPHYGFQSRLDQKGYVCMEYWQDNFDAIQYAWARGVTVIEAAGNGAENFDDPLLYGQLFDTLYRNSHAIVAGAGYPAASANDRRRLGFSNYGNRVNLQGYGSGVYTTGYGDMFTGGGDENQYYTASFSGTSSASPIVTGSVACLQGRYKALHGTYLTADVIRTLLVATGSPQLGDLSTHIGPRPDLFAAFAALTGPPSLTVSPILIDTSLSQGVMITTPVWLHNRSISTPVAFTVSGNDSLAKALMPDWLRTSPNAGTVNPSDSARIDITVDAAILPSRVGQYKGIVQIHWGPTPLPLDSLTQIPVFLRVPCSDTTYSAVASWEAGGPGFAWIDARTLGSKIPNTSYYSSGVDPRDDGTAGPLPIGFSFPYFDSSYSSMFVGVNGAISFTDTNLNVGGLFSGLPMPGVPFKTFVSAFWSDLLIDSVKVQPAGVYVYKSPTLDTIVIEWYRLANFVNADTLTNFEIILTSAGRIKFQYQQVVSSTLNQSALLGISEIECRALDWFNNNDIPAHLVVNSTAVQFTPRRLKMSGEVDGSPGIDIGDLMFLVDFLTGTGPAPSPYLMGDVNCDATVDIGDVLFMADFLKSVGPEPCLVWLTL